MPLVKNFSLPLYENGTIVIGLTPATAIGGWDIRFQMMKAQGGTSLLTKYVSSGFTSYVSGMTIINSGEGRIGLRFYPAEVSGLDPGNYFYRIDRTQSGFSTGLVEGIRTAGG